MIDPYDLDHPWDEHRLQEWILFGICVANKPASVTAKKLEGFLYESFPSWKAQPLNPTPFDKVNHLVKCKTLRSRLEKYRVGQYSRIEKAFCEVVTKIPEVLKTSIEELETVSGIGPKTARMIVLYWKPETECAPLDTHVLKWLRQEGYDAPKGTPSGRKYRELEKIFIREAKWRGYTPKQLDEIVWNMFARPQK
jgi:endonuclease III